MARKQWYFGRVGYNQAGVTSATMRYAPAPDTGLSATRSGYVETVSFENGGAGVVRSAASARSFDCDFGVSEASGQNGLDVYTDYAQGLYGISPVYVADPMAYTANVFPPNWASPGLAQQGWKPIYPTSPTAYPATATNVYSQPRTGATYNITTAINSIPAGGNTSIFIPIEPGNALYLGAAGSATGSGVVQLRPITRAGAYATNVNLTLLSATGATRVNTTFSGDTFLGVVVYLARTSTAASTVTLTSLMGQVYKLYTGDASLYPSTTLYPGVVLYPSSSAGSTPYSVYDATGQFVAGRGQSGMEFSTDAVAETYTMVDNGSRRSLKGMSFALTEVTPWRGGAL